MMQDIERLFFRKPSNILVLLLENEMSLSEIATRANIDHPYVIITTRKLEEGKVVKTKKEGRKRMVRLTKDGEELAMLLRKVKRFKL
jgi:predicted transcriptional regulator